MQHDARFEDGEERPIYLKARDSDDLSVISTLIQDAVLPMKETSWQPDINRFGLLINRFRWEDKTSAENAKRSFERVQSVLVFDGVTGVASMGIDYKDPEQIVSILSVNFQAGDDEAGKVIITLAGDGALALDVECLDLTLKDVTKPYEAISKSAPKHDLDS